MDFVNFNEHITRTLLNEYGGSERKRTVVLDDGNKYLLKFPDPTREVAREISYINNAISEYIGCHIYEQAGFQVQKTILGTFTQEVNGNAKEKIACACKDVRNTGEVLHQVDTITLSLLEGDLPITFDNVKVILNNLEGLNSEEAFKEYCNRFIADAFIGNPDRHNGNWGIIESEEGLRIAPVYDCGSSLSPLYADEELTEALARNEAHNIKSVVVDDNGVSLHYRDFLLSKENENINRALREVVPRIDLSKAIKTVEDIPYISDKRKAFYIGMLKERHEKVLIPALENVLGIEKSQEYKEWNSKVIGTIYDKYIGVFESLPDNGRVNFKNADGNPMSYEYIKSSGYVFFLNENKESVGLVNLTRSNLNVCKFVQAARAMNIPIDAKIEALKAEGRKEQAYSKFESFEIQCDKLSIGENTQITFVNNNGYVVEATATKTANAEVKLTIDVPEFNAHNEFDVSLTNYGLKVDKVLCSAFKGEYDHTNIVIGKGKGLN